MFRESRLINFAQDGKSSTQDDTGSNPEKDQPKEPKAPETKEEKEAQQKKNFAKKVQELKLKTQNANISKGTKTLVQGALDSNDPDEVDLVEKLVGSNTINQAEFEDKLIEIRDKKRGLKSKNNLPDITSDVAKRSKAAANLRTQTPESLKQNKSYSQTVDKLEQTSANEAQIQSSITSLLEPHVKSGKISAEYQARIANLDPHSSEFSTFLTKYLGPDLSTNKKLVAQIKQLKADQKDSINGFNSLMESLEQLMLADADKYESKRQEHSKIRSLSSRTGLTISEGSTLEYVTINKNLERVIATTLIQKVEYKRQPSRFYGDDNSDTAVNKELEEESLNFPKQLYITVSDDHNGQAISRTLDEQEFIEWVAQKQVTEVVSDFKDLQDKIGFLEHGQELKIGTELEYITHRSSKGEPVLDTLKINQIDPSSKTIVLSKPVTVLRASDTKENPDLSKNRLKTHLSYGEFLKWFNQSNAEEKMDLKKAKDVLKKMPMLYQSRYPDLDPAIWEFNQLPISLAPNEQLVWGGNKKATITTVDSDKITLSNGSTYTPGQFLKFIKTNEVERAATVPDQDEIQDKIDNLLNPDSAKGAADTSGKVAARGPSQTAEPEDRVGILEQMWKDTTFLSINDLMKMFQTVEEFFKRRTERNSKRRAAETGKHFPGRLGLEFKNLAQSSENEEVDKIQGELKQQGVDDWRNELLNAGTNTDIIKACTNLLCESGSFDFEDQAIWIAFNKAYAEKVDKETYEKNKINLNGRKNEAGFESIKAIQFIMDSIWGKPSGTNWFNQNKSAYNGEIGKFKEECKDLEAVPGGLQSAMHEMIVRHQNGEYQSPARFEAYLRYIIEAGKCSMEDKVFYLIAGYVLENKETGTFLLNKSKIGTLDNDLMNAMPHMDFFVKYKPLLGDRKDEVIPRDYMLEIFNSFKSNSTGTGERYDAQAVSDFLWKDIMTHPATLFRIGRIGRNGQDKLDHDDTQFVIPGMDTGDLNIILGTKGNTPIVTPDGHANGIAGFNQYIKTLSQLAALPEDQHGKRKEQKLGDPAELIQKALKGFLFYESTVTGRVLYSASHEQSALSTERLNRPAPGDASNTPVIKHIQEVKELLREILTAYNVDPARIQMFLDHKTGKSDQDGNKLHSEELRKFSSYFDSLISSQGSEKMLKVVANSTGRISGIVANPNAPQKTKEEKEEEAKKTQESLSELRDPNEIMGLTKKAANKNVEGAK